jgi:hypothetical protein
MKIAPHAGFNSRVVDDLFDRPRTQIEGALLEALSDEVAWKTIFTRTEPSERYAECETRREAGHSQFSQFRR